jgi:hypothetical protein
MSSPAERYFDLLMELASERPQADLLNRIERFLSQDRAPVPQAAGPAAKKGGYVCSRCGGRKSWYSSHCRRCNAGATGNAGGKGGDRRSPAAVEEQLARNRETVAIQEHIEEPVRVAIGDRPRVDVTRLPRSLRQELGVALQNQNGARVRELVGSR